MSQTETDSVKTKINAEIDSVKRKIKAIEDVLNYHVAVEDALEKGLPAPVLNLDSSFLMYKKMTQEQLQEEKRQLQEEKKQLQEKDNLLLRGNLAL